MKIAAYFGYLLGGILTLGCSEEADVGLEFSIDQSIPSTRSFYMGFTAFPYDITTQAREQSYRNQRDQGDILLTHFDHGVPWNEALNDLPFPDEVQTAIDETVANKTSHHKVFLTATATDTDRDKLAKYWNNSGSQQTLPDFWRDRSFDSPEVISAYKKYCFRIIDAIQPNYFAFGIEINASFLKGSPAYTSYLSLADSVYQSLKSAYPELPIMLTFQDQSFNKDQAELHIITKELLEYSDYIAVSTYPFWQYNYPEREANPKLFENSWLAEMRNLAPNKPFAVSETGYCAEDFSVRSFGVDIEASAEWQAEYVQKLLAESNKLDAAFVIWFVYRDYDRLEANLDGPSDVLKIWRDNGLQDGEGIDRPAHAIWDVWKSLPVN